GRALFLHAFHAKRKRGKRELFILEFHGGAYYLACEDVLRQVQAHVHANKREGGKNAGHENAGNQAGEDKEEKIVAGIDGRKGHQHDYPCGSRSSEAACVWPAREPT